MDDIYINVLSRFLAALAVIETLPIAGINSFVAWARQVCRATGNTACTTFFTCQNHNFGTAIQRHSSVIMAENISSSEINNAIFSSLIFFPGIHELKSEQIRSTNRVWKKFNISNFPSVLKSLQSSYVSPSPLVIVVCPLKSIIKDQVNYLRSLGLKGGYVGESDELDKRIINGTAQIDLLYGSPESFVGEEKIHLLYQ